MTIWLVYQSDCEGETAVCACGSKDRALAEWNALRQRLLTEVQEREAWARSHCPDAADSVYAEQIQALSCTDPATINNYPHDTPKLREMELLP